MLTSSQETGYAQSQVLPPWFGENNNTAPVKLLPLNIHLLELSSSWSAI